MDILNPILSGPEGYLYTLIVTLTSPNSIPNANQALITIVAAFITAKLIGDPQTKYKDNTDDVIYRQKRVFDFIVVGSGSCGSVMGARLTQDPSLTTLIIEAGCEDPILTSEVPLLFVTLLRSDQDWQYISGDKNVAGAVPSGHYLPRAKMFCGCPGMNLMYNMIGSPDTYNNWRDNYGCTDWGWDDVLPYFKMSENETDNNMNSTYHGYNGPIKISNYYNDPYSDLLIKGINESGVNIVQDGAVPQGPGVFRVQGTLYGGRRWAVCKGYINPIQSRKNLYIAKCAVVTKILFNENNTATGVEFFYKGKTYQVYARREVILCAGAIGTPILLQLSGIGRPEDLNKIRVRPLNPNLSLDVGHYLWDHLAAWTWFSLDGEEDSVLDLVRNITEYNINPTNSYFSGVGTAQVIAYLEVPISNGTAIIECYFFVFKKNSLLLASAQGWFQYNTEIQNYLNNVNKNSMIMVIGSSLLTPECYGHVLAKTTDYTAFDKPDIFFNYLCKRNGYDETALIQIVQYWQSVAKNSPAWEKANVKFLRLPLVPCASFGDTNSTDYIKCFLSQMAMSIYHPVGTARMGIAPPAVCNPQGQVYGVNNLTIADASVMPYIVNCNTNRPTVMIAEKMFSYLKQRQNMNT